MTPWKLPLIVAAIAAPIALAFLVAGPGIGLAVGALSSIAILAIAAAQRPRGPIVSASSLDSRRYVLVVVSRPIEAASEVREIARAAGIEGGQAGAEVLVLAPARIGFLDRWASDLEAARRRAQQNLVITVASLAKAGLVAEARVGDEDLVQAVEDQLQTFPATEVILATDDAGEDEAGASAAAELESRLQAGFHHLVLEATGG
ncbi:MAG TPA: hypothetical protein VII45_07930 [Solirubrobacterales bacterium]